MFETLKLLNRRLQLIDCGDHNITEWIAVNIEDMVLLATDGESPTVTTMISPTEAQLLAYIHDITKDTSPLYLAMSEKTGDPFVFGNHDFYEFGSTPFATKDRLYLIRCSSQDDCISFALANNEDELLRLLEAEARDVDPNSSVVLSCTCSKNTPGRVEFETVVEETHNIPGKAGETEKDVDTYTDTYDIYGYYELLQ